MIPKARQPVRLTKVALTITTTGRLSVSTIKGTAALTATRTDTSKPPRATTPTAAVPWPRLAGVIEPRPETHIRRSPVRSFQLCRR